MTRILCWFGWHDYKWSECPVIVRHRNVLDNIIGRDPHYSEEPYETTGQEGICERCGFRRIK